MNFVVKSKSSGNEYNVQVYTTEDGPVITCDCPAGENGQYCKHRFALISGDESEVVEADAPVSEIAKLVVGSRLEATIDAMAITHPRIVLSGCPVSGQGCGDCLEWMMSGYFLGIDDSSDCTIALRRPH